MEYMAGGSVADLVGYFHVLLLFTSLIISVFWNLLTLDLKFHTVYFRIEVCLYWMRWNVVYLSHSLYQPYVFSTLSIMILAIPTWVKIMVLQKFIYSSHAWNNYEIKHLYSFYGHYKVYFPRHVAWGTFLIWKNGCLSIHRSIKEDHECNLCKDLMNSSHCSCSYLVTY